MDTQGELINTGLLTSEIVDTNLRVGDTSTETRLRVRFVLAVAIASRWTATHFDL